MVVLWAVPGQLRVGPFLIGLDSVSMVLVQIPALFIFLCNGKWAAFIQGFSNQQPLKALYNTASHSPIHAHIHLLTAISVTQGYSQPVRSSQGEVSCSGTPWHSARRSRGSNYQPSGYKPNRSASWATCHPRIPALKMKLTIWAFSLLVKRRFIMSCGEITCIIFVYYICVVVFFLRVGIVLF